MGYYRAKSDKRFRCESLPEVCHKRRIERWVHPVLGEPEEILKVRVFLYVKNRILISETDLFLDVKGTEGNTG